MEKLTAILAVAHDDADDEAPILAKAGILARAFGARIDVLRAPTHDSAALEGAILNRVYSERHDLVMKAPAGRHPLRRVTLDANDWRLARECPVPLLLARARPWAQPMRIAAAVDIANDDGAGLARTIVHTAGFLALGCDAELEVLYSEREARDEALRMERAVKLAQVIREFHVGCERLRRFEGAPEATLPPELAKRVPDLLVLGSQRDSALAAALIPGVSSALADAAAGDIVFVKGAGPLGVRAASHPSTRLAAL